MKTKQELKAQKLTATLDEARAAAKGQKFTNKKSVSLHTKDAAPIDAGQAVGVMAPNDEQLSRINQFTRSPKSADQLVVFSTMSANTLPDRDDDMFTKRTITEFAAMEAPYGPTGKSYMVGHNYQSLAVGRIFGTGTAKAEDALFLTNEVYIPNTAGNQQFIEAVDFGVNWAVSVGVMLEQVLCSLCDAQMMGSWYPCCANGHFKSAYYDLGSDEVDNWGYPLEVDPAKNPKAVKAMGLMDGAKDFYELSQVFLGAQFFAELDSPKAASMKGVLKAAGKVPLLGLSAKEAETLPMLHVDERIVKALQTGSVERDKDGTVKWTDADGLIWMQQPGDPIMCLGKAVAEVSTDEEVNDNGEEHHSAEGGSGEPLGDGGTHSGSLHERGLERNDGDGEVAGSDPAVGEPAEPGQDGLASALTARLSALRGRVKAATEADDPDAEEDDSPVAMAQALDAVLDEISEALDEQDYATADDLLTAAESTADDLIELLGGTDADDVENGEPPAKGVQPEVSRQAVLAAAKKAKAPVELLQVLFEAPEGDNGLDAILGAAVKSIRTLKGERDALAPKAAMGDEFIKSLRSEAIDWYVKSNVLDGAQGVDTATFEKILDACGDNVELIQALSTQQADIAKSKGPKLVRRSSFDHDPNSPDLPVEHVSATTPAARSSRTVSRLHG